jgi:hypothetical protein
MNWKAKKIKEGKYRKYKQSNNATTTTAPPAPIPSDGQVDINALRQQMANLAQLCKAAVSKKRILIDSGCNTTIIASKDHSDDNILYRDYLESIATANGQLIPIIEQGSILIATANGQLIPIIEQGSILIATANGQLIPIIGQGSILTMPADYVPTFVDSLISVSQVTKLRNSCVIFFKDIALTIFLRPSIITLLNQTNSIAVDNNLLLCTAALTTDNLYAVNDPIIDNKLSPLLANATYYQTA